MKRKMTAGQTSVSVPIFVQDTSSTTGGGLSGLTSGTSGLVAEYRRRGQSSWTAITLTSKTLGTWTSGGIVADGALAGAYELDLPDAVCASGARWVAVRLRGAANMLPCLIEIELDACDYQIDALGAVKPTTAGRTLTVDASGFVTVATNNDKTGYSLTQSFPSNFASMAITVGGAVTAGTVSDKTGYSLTPTTGLGNQTANITGNLSGSVGSVTSGVTVATNNDKTGYSLASGGLSAISTWTVAITGNITGNLSGSVGSVSGNVGGNVTGSVGSISGVTFPSNFGSMSITVGGAVTAGTVSDKTGYSLTPTTGLGNQTANITGNLSGSVGSVSSGVTVDTNNDKTGYSLTAGTGLGNQTANITGSLSGSVGSVSGNVGGNVVGSVGSVTSGVTVTTNNDKSGYSLATAPPTAAAIADAVWDEPRTGHTTSGTFGFYLDAAISGISGGGGGGSSAADIWAYATRTLTSTLTITTDDIDAIVAGITAAGPGLYNVIRNDDLTLRIGDEFEQAITGLGDLTGYSDIVFTLKSAESDADTAAKVYLSKNNGLTRLNGAAYGTPANGTITIDNATNGDITIRISSAATASLTKATRVDAVKVLQSGGNDRTPRVGRTQVLPVVVEARG